jgi:DNA-3-methyladenine glycosylase II
MDYSVAIAALKQSDSRLAEVIERVGACTLAQDQRTHDLLFSLSESIIHQQLSSKAAATIHRRFLELYPSKAAPSAEDILNTTDEQLRSVGISRPKITYLKDLAQKVSEGLPTLAQLELMDDHAIIQTLLPIRGIGSWTVQMLLIFRLHRWDVLPVDDLGIRSSMRRVYELAELPDKKSMEALAMAWQPYRTIACWYLWRHLDF